jgi:hypothetical protein
MNLINQQKLLQQQSNNFQFKQPQSAPTKNKFQKTQGQVELQPLGLDSFKSLEEVQTKIKFF